MRAQAPQPGPVVVSAPLGDVQLIALIAAQASGMRPDEAVEWALDVIAETVVQFDGGKGLAERINARKAE